MTVQKLIFYRGLLFALRLECTHLRISPHREFNSAFGKMIAFAIISLLQNESFNFLREIRPDPMFDNYEEASEMWSEGENDLLIIKSGNSITFQVSEEVAKRELSLLPEKDNFLKIGHFFAQELRARGLITDRKEGLRDESNRLGS